MVIPLNLSISTEFNKSPDVIINVSEINLEFLRQGGTLFITPVPITKPIYTYQMNSILNSTEINLSSSELDPKCLKSFHNEIF